MKNALLLHGTSCTPNSYWLPNIKGFLEKQGFAVFAPLLPNPDKPDLKVQLPFILNNFDFNTDSVIVGHSAGCPLALGILEKIKVKIDKAVLVAGYARVLDKTDELAMEEGRSILQKRYNWKRIRGNVNDLVFINSDNDPWGCNDKEGYYMFRRLGGTLIIKHGDGHFGSDTFNQPYKEFPLLEKLLG